MQGVMFDKVASAVKGSAGRSFMGLSPQEAGQFLWGLASHLVGGWKR